MRTRRPRRSRQSCVRGGHEVRLQVVDGSEIAQTLQKAAKSGFDAVVVGGGDGTIGCAAQALTFTQTALGILPLGTMNLMAKDLGIPLTLKEAAQSLAAGKTMEIDVGDVNGRMFLCSSIMGVFPLLARQRERERGRGPLGWLHMLQTTIAAALRYRPVHLLMRHDKAAQRIKTTAMVIANNAYGGDGIGSAALTRPSLNKGELVVYVARHKAPSHMLMLFARLMLGNWRNDPEIDTIALKRLNVHSLQRRLSVMNDGEVMVLNTPLRYRIRPRALNVLVPA